MGDQRPGRCLFEETRTRNLRPRPRIPRTRRTTFGLGALALLLAACGAEAPLSPGDGGGRTPPSDGGADFSDASATDAAAAVPFPGFSADPENDIGLSPGAGEDRASCYESACAGGACAELASCCIGRADCCVETESDLPEALPFACELDACLAEVPHVRFGAPEPFTVGTAGLAAGGDGHYDSGLLLGGALGLTSRRVRLTARFDRTPCTDGGCVVAFSVGLTAQTAVDTTTHVTPLIAMQVSAARDGVALVVADREVARAPSFDADARWTLEARPDGLATLLRDDVPVATARYAPAPAARVVLFGHALNPGATESGEPRVLLRELEAQVAVCDAASAWRGRELLRIFEGATERVFDEVEDVSVARVGATTWLAFTAVENDRRELHVARDSAGFALLPSAAYPDALRAASSPALAVDPTGNLQLVVVAEGGGLTAFRWDEARFVSSSLDLHTLPHGLSEPSLLYHLGHAVLVARDGERIVVHLRGPSTGDVWAGLPGALDDLEGARQPTLVVHQRAFLLHHAWRSGTRWQLGLVASDELVAWRSVRPDALEASVGFDARGPRAASALSDGDELALYYVADDGVRRRLARTRREAPRDARLGGGS